MDDSSIPETTPIDGHKEEDFDDNGILFLEEESGYMEPALSTLALIHSLLSFAMLVSYYILKVEFYFFKICHRVQKL